MLIVHPDHLIRGVIAVEIDAITLVDRHRFEGRPKHSLG